MNDGLLVGGSFDVECVNPDGSVAWRERLKNGVTSAGLNDLLSVYLAGGAQTTAWYVGLIDGSGTPALSASDTMSSHAGWSENTSYSETTRQAFTPGAVAGQSVGSTASPAVFTASGASTVYGAFLTSGSAKGGSVGKLWATGAFASPRPLVAGQQLRCDYTLNAAGS